MAQLCRDKATQLTRLLEDTARLAELRLESRRTRAKIDGSLASLGSSTSSLRQGSHSRLANQDAPVRDEAQQEFGSVDAFADFPVELALEGSASPSTELEPQTPLALEPVLEVDANPSTELQTPAVVVHFKEDPACLQPENPFALDTQTAESASETSPVASLPEQTNPFAEAAHGRSKWVEPQTNPFDMSQNPLEDDPFADM